MTSAYTPDDLEQFLRKQGIDAQLVREIGDTPTVPAAAAALGVEPDRIVKTLLFLVNDPKQPEQPPQPVVVISHGERRVEKRPLADYFGVGKKQVNLAPPEVVLAQLGYPAGGVPPLGHRHALPVLLDASIAAFPAETIIYGGGGDDRTMLALRVDELIQRTAPTAILALS